MRALLVTLAAGFAGCLQPVGGQPPPIRRFNPKEEMPPPPIISPTEVLGYSPSASDSPPWAVVFDRAPSPFGAIPRQETPTPGTAWYEYMVTGRRCFSDADTAIANELVRAEAMPVEDANAALHHLNFGSAAFELGMNRSAKHHFDRAVFWMEKATDQDLERLAIVTRSDAKVYKGDAFEHRRQLNFSI